MDINEIKSKIWDPNYKYFTIQGRIGKQEFIGKYLMPLLAFIVAAIVIGIVCGILMGVCAAISDTLASIVGIVCILLYLVLAVAGIFVGVMNLCGQVRRFHDFGVTGWAVLIAHVFGFGIITLIVGLIMEGHDNANKYGEPNGK